MPREHVDVSRCSALAPRSVRSDPRLTSGPIRLRWGWRPLARRPRRGGTVMHVVIRRWAGSGPLIAEMERRSGEVEGLLRGVPGFGAYYALRSGTDGLATVTVCDDRAGADESTRRAREWVQQHVPGLIMGGP